MTAEPKQVKVHTPEPGQTVLTTADLELIRDAVLSKQYSGRKRQRAKRIVAALDQMLEKLAKVLA